MASRNEDLHEIAVQVLADTLWRGRLDDVRRGAQQRASVGKNDNATADTPLLANISFMPGPSFAAHLPSSHPLQGFFTVCSQHPPVFCIETVILIRSP